MTVRVGDLAEKVRLVSAETSLAAVQRSLIAEPECHFLTVIRDRKPVGVVARAAVMELAATSGPAAVEALNVGELISAQPLRAEASTPAAKLALAHRSDDFARLQNGVIITDARRYIGVLSLPKLLKAVAEENAARARAMQNTPRPAETEPVPVETDISRPSATAGDTQFLLATLAHEVRTPLTGMMGLAEMLAARMPDVETRDIAETIVRSGDTLDRILKDTLDFVSLESGHLKPQAEPSDLNDLVSDLRRLWSAQAARRKLSLHVSFSPDGPHRIDVDLGRVRQVVNNLVSNALKFTHEGGVSVVIGTQPLGQSLMLSVEVADTGRGISGDDKTRFFKAFERGEMPKDAPGWGLGLTISHALARHLGGRLSVSDNPGGGSVFTLMVPVSRSAVVTMPTRKAPKSGQFTLGEVLVIEDHEACAMIVLEALQQAGWAVRHAHSITQAEDLISSQSFQAILTDLHLVDGSALALIDRLRRRSDSYGSIPILAMTADISEGTRKACMAMGADRALNKPIQGPALVATLADVLMSRAAADTVVPALRGRLAG